MENTPQVLSDIDLGVGVLNGAQISDAELCRISPWSTNPQRRNGLTPACEPCRQRQKVRCDSVPFGSLCSRCRKRNTSEKCVFLESPDDQASTGNSQAPRASFAAPKSPSQARNGTTVLSPSIQCNLNGGVTRKAAGPSGFLGQTSFSATIHDPEDDDSCDEGERTDPMSAIDPAEVAMGMNVLRVLPRYDVVRLC